MSIFVTVLVIYFMSIIPNNSVFCIISIFAIILIFKLLALQRSNRQLTTRPGHEWISIADLIIAADTYTFDIQPSLTFNHR